MDDFLTSKMLRMARQVNEIGKILLIALSFAVAWMVYHGVQTWGLGDTWAFWIAAATFVASSAHLQKSWAKE